MAGLLRDIAMPSLSSGNVASQGSIRDMQMQQLAASPEVTRKKLPQIGSQLASQAAQDQVKNIQSAMQQWAPSAGQDLQEQEAAGRRQIAQAGMAADREMADDQEKLGKINSALADSISAERNEFLLDKAGKKYLNERQLADYKVLTARSAQELEDYRQKVDQMQARRKQMTDTALKKVEAFLNNQYDLEAAGLNAEQRVRLARNLQAAKMEEEKRSRKAAEKSAKNGLLGTVSSSLLVAGTGLMATGVGIVPGAVMAGVGAVGVYGATRGWGSKL